MPTLAPAGDAVLAETISAGAADLALPLDAEQLMRLVAYIRLIERWNGTYNLTSIRDPRQMASHHILDCLAAAAALFRRRPPSTPTKLLDVGSGAGLPGLVVAILAPGWSVSCVDAVGKKAAFMTQASGQLGLRSVTVRHGRVEQLTDASFDVIASRAFSSLAEFVAYTRALLDAEGFWMAMKGRMPADELKDLAGIRFHVEPLAVPALGAERCVVWMHLSEPSLVGIPNRSL